MAHRWTRVEMPAFGCVPEETVTFGFDRHRIETVHMLIHQRALPLSQVLKWREAMRQASLLRRLRPGAPQVLAILLGLLLASIAAADEDMKVVAVKGDYASVKDDVVTAIDQRGLIVNSVSHIGDMLERTGRDLGRTRRIYDKAEVVEFCSAVVSRNLMEADPRNVVYCPFSIAVYTLPGRAGEVFLAYRKYPAGAPASQVTELLEGIIADVAR
jgi:uncharacterized protein (DUF302 family)